MKMTQDIRVSVYNLEDMLGITRVKVSTIIKTYKRGCAKHQVLTSTKLN